MYLSFGFALDLIIMAMLGALVVGIFGLMRNILRVKK